MALASAVLDIDLTRRNKRVTVSVTPSGNYTTGGDTLDLTKTTNPNFLPGAALGGVPLRAEVLTSPDGYNAEVILGATLQTAKLKVYSAAGTEITGAAAYPTALDTDPFQVVFIGKIGQM